MALALSLRSDLKKLSVEELAWRLDGVEVVLDSAGDTLTSDRLHWSSRGPIRHRWAYPLVSFLSVSGFLWFEIYIAFEMNILCAIPGATWMRPFYNRHLALCEFRDIMDELERRKKRRR
jgi:hypothetical protein